MSQCGTSLHNLSHYMSSWQSNSPNSRHTSNSQGHRKPLETRGFIDLPSSLHLKRRGFWLRSTYWTGLCNYETRKCFTYTSCKDIIVSMLWEMNFYFQLYACMFCLFRKKLGGRVPPPPSPSPCYSPDTVFLPNKVSCVKILVNPAHIKTLCISQVQSNPGSQQCPSRHYFRLSVWFTQPLPTFI